MSHTRSEILRPARGRSDLFETSGKGAFPKSARIRTSQEFDRVHQQAVRVHRRRFTVLGCRSLVGPDAGARFGCAVSRKVGNAVVRNRLKRLMREAFRMSRGSLPAVDLVVILRPEAADWVRDGLGAVAGELLPAMLEAGSLALEGKKSGRGNRRRRGKSVRPQR